MASEVRSGTSNPSYTNNTGQNVRIVINYMKSLLSSGSARISLTWAGVTEQAYISAPGVADYDPSGSSTLPQVSFCIGRNIANISHSLDSDSSMFASNAGLSVVRDATSGNTQYTQTGVYSINDPSIVEVSSESGSKRRVLSITLPTELMLADKQTFSAVCGAYNIVIIPEA